MFLFNCSSTGCTILIYNHGMFFYSPIRLKRITNNYFYLKEVLEQTTTWRYHGRWRVNKNIHRRPSIRMLDFICTFQTLCGYESSRCGRFVPKTISYPGVIIRTKYNSKKHSLKALGKAGSRRSDVRSWRTQPTPLAGRFTADAGRSDPTPRVRKVLGTNRLRYESSTARLFVPEYEKS